MPSYLHLAHRRTARMAAKGRVVKEDNTLEKIRKRCREDFGFFCEYISDGKKKPAAHHKEWIKNLVTEEDTNCLTRIGGKDLAILAPRGPLDIETPVATPDGWRPLKDIEVGDYVFADDGTPTRVTDTVDYGPTECWEVIMSDGTSVICDDSHRWSVRRTGSKHKDEWRITTLQEIRLFKPLSAIRYDKSDQITTWEQAEKNSNPWIAKNGRPCYQVPIAAPVEYEEKDLPIDPYLLGVLLGDGALSTGSVRFHKNEPEMADRIRSTLPDICELKEVKPGTGDYRIVHRMGYKCPKYRDGRLSNPVKQSLSELGLWGKLSGDKFIPTVYLQGSVQQREALLQGLLDTDGTCTKSYVNGGISFSSTSRMLIEGVSEIVRSLGGIVTQRKPYHASYANKQGERIRCKVSYRIGIRLPGHIRPFFIRRKASRYVSPSTGVANGGLRRTIVDIKPAGLRSIRCITVEHPNESFVIRDYVLVKNSSKSTSLGLFTAWAIGIHAEAKLPLKILYISYTVDVARPKSAAIKNVVDSKKYQEIFPTVRIKKGMTSNEYWSIDYKFAGIEETGDEQFTVCCAGLKGSITSKRSSLVIIDDCIKAANDIKNPEVRREMQENWNSVIAPTMFEGARAICLGTRFRHDDIFATTFIPKNGWQQVVQQAIISDEYGNPQSYWPEMWSLEYLEKKKKTAPISFSFQYMNQIVRQSELSLSPDLLIRSEIATEFDTIGVGIDLSSGTKDRNDYTVFTLGGRIGDKIHVIDYRRFRVMGNLEKLDKLMELLSDWNLLTTDGEGAYYPTFSVCDIWSEAVQYQASIEADFKRICLQEQGLHNLKWHAVKGFKSDKLARFRGIMGMFEQRKIVFNRYRGFGIMFDELTNFGTSGHDDCVDSLVYLVNGLMRRGSLELDY